MFNFPNIYQKSLTVKNILSRTTEAEIFRHYFGEYHLNTFYNSPLRKDDKIPSFNIYIKNGLRYKDFGGTQGSCFDFVMNLYGISFYESLVLINNDMGLGLTSPAKKIVYPEYEELEIKNTSIEVRARIRKWEQYDLDYWEEYKIKQDTRKRFEIYPAQELWSKHYGYNWKKIWINTRDNPIYVYNIPEYTIDNNQLIFDNYKLKGYRPYQTEKYGRNSRYKWFTGFSGRYIQGLEQVDYSKDFIFITSSLKDVCTLYEIGITSIAPNAEGSYISEELINYLKTKFNRIYVNYDNDSPGVTASIKFTQQYELSYWNIPRHYGTKDVSDFVKKYSQKELLEIINRKI